MNVPCCSYYESRRCPSYNPCSPCDRRCSRICNPCDYVCEPCPPRTPSSKISSFPLPTGVNATDKNDPRSKKFGQDSNGKNATDKGSHKSGKSKFGNKRREHKKKGKDGGAGKGGTDRHGPGGVGGPRGPGDLGGPGTGPGGTFGGPGGAFGGQGGAFGGPGGAFGGQGGAFGGQGGAFGGPGGGFGGPGGGFGGPGGAFAGPGGGFGGPGGGFGGPGGALGAGGANLAPCSPGYGTGGGVQLLAPCHPEYIAAYERGTFSPRDQSYGSNYQNVPPYARRNSFGNPNTTRGVYAQQAPPDGYSGMSNRTSAYGRTGFQGSSYASRNVTCTPRQETYGSVGPSAYASRQPNFYGANTNAVKDEYVRQSRCTPREQNVYGNRMRSDYVAQNNWSPRQEGIYSSHASQNSYMPQHVREYGNAGPNARCSPSSARSKDRVYGGVRGSSICNTCGSINPIRSGFDGIQSFGSGPQTNQFAEYRHTISFGVCAPVLR